MATAVSGSTREKRARALTALRAWLRSGQRKLVLVGPAPVRAAVLAKLRANLPEGLRATQGPDPRRRPVDLETEWVLFADDAAALRSVLLRSLAVEAESPGHRMRLVVGCSGGRSLGRVLRNLGAGIEVVSLEEPDEPGTTAFFTRFGPAGPALGFAAAALAVLLYLMPDPGALFQRDAGGAAEVHLVTSPSPAPAPPETAPAVSSPPAPAPRTPRRRARPRPAVTRVAVAAPSPVAVSVNAIPSAAIAVDGAAVGRTPVIQLRVAPGTRRFVATFDDGRVVERTVRVDGDELYLLFP